MLGHVRSQGKDLDNQMIVKVIIYCNSDVRLDVIKSLQSVVDNSFWPSLFFF